MVGEGGHERRDREYAVGGQQCADRAGDQTEGGVPRPD